jgi:hypothetical protein
MADTGLGGEMHHIGEPVRRKQRSHAVAVLRVELVNRDASQVRRGALALMEQDRNKALSLSVSTTELLAKLLAKYAEFQRRRPDLPQGDL